MKWYSFGATEENIVVFETWLSSHDIILHSTFVHHKVRLPKIDGFMTNLLCMDMQIRQEVWGGVMVSQMLTLLSNKGEQALEVTNPIERSANNVGYDCSPFLLGRPSPSLWEV